MELIGYTLVAVPEPGRIVLVEIGLISLVWRRRRRG
jgi:hypothetical protein